MMKDDETIALTALRVGTDWDLMPWFNIKWDTDQQKFRTFIELDAEYDGKEGLYELLTLDDAATLEKTATEYATNTSTLIQNGRLKRNEVKDERMMTAVASRIANTDEDLPYSLVTIKNWVQPAAADLRGFTPKEEKTGLFVLKVVQLLSSIGYWQDSIAIKHPSTKWNSRLNKHELTEPHFTLTVTVHWMFSMECITDVRIDERTYPELEQAVEDILFNAHTTIDYDDEVNLSSYAVMLYAARQEQYHAITDAFKRGLPEDFVDLFAETASYNIVPEYAS